MKKAAPFLLDLLLLLLIAIGVVFRFSWVNWNEDADLHPDEYGLTSTISALALPKSLAAYFNTRLSTLSPYNKYDETGQTMMDGPDNRMRWGQWPITIIRAAAEWTGNTRYGEIRLLGRRISALADVLTLLVVFLTGWKLYGRRAGLLAMALGSLAVLEIQQSHFMTADMLAMLFAALTIWATVNAGLEPIPGRKGLPRWAWYALAGIFFGMTVASRINLAVLAGVIALAAGIHLYNSTRGFRAWQLRPIAAAGLCLALAGVLSLITFRLTQPMSFRAPTGDTTLLTVHFNQDWVDSMKVAQDESKGINAGPPGEQWTNRTILWFPFYNMVVWGMGLPLGIAAWAGFAWAAWRFLRRCPDGQRHLIPLAWAGGLFLFMGTRHVMSVRYFLPIYPFLCLFAAWALLKLFERPDPALPNSTTRLGIPIALLGIVMFGSLAWSTAFVSAVYMPGNTRVRATRWIFQNIPGPFNLQFDTGSTLYNLPVAAPDSNQLNPGHPFALPFQMETSGVLRSVLIPHLRSLDSGDPASQVTVAVTRDIEGRQVLSKGTGMISPLKSNPRGEPFSAGFPPVQLQGGQFYFLIISIDSGGPAVAQRVVVANENWDESLPVRMDGYDPFGQFYTGVTMEVRWLDSDQKRQMYRDNLAAADYIILPSQRSIWSISRLPDSYPLTMQYYRALFSGKLGFDLVKHFEAPLRLGPLYISDLAGTAALGRPPELPLFNNNLLGAEEAFSVYDHAPVWIFKKSESFDLAAAYRSLP